jgi:hypothetical protein
MVGARGLGMAALWGVGLAAVASAVLEEGGRPMMTPADYEITELPGLAHQPTFKQYSGLSHVFDLSLL